jgi:hypothetical protein
MHYLWTVLDERTDVLDYGYLNPDMFNHHLWGHLKKVHEQEN